MSRIRSALFARDSGLRDRLLPTRFIDIADIAEDDEISEAYRRITGVCHLGIQYPLLARYCRQSGLTGLELGIEKRAENQASSFIAPHDYKNKQHIEFNRLIARQSSVGESRFIFDPRLCSADEYAIFRYFTVPLFSLDKTDIARIADELGFAELMEMTWFCHRPLFGKYACGRCNPCIDVLLCGLGRRIAWPGKAIGFAMRVLPLRSIKARFSRAGRHPAPG